ncbi:hypothetical protein AGMMS49574_11290 [Bacteroidia bacterium]|nr:hypothetical protein AGMMS49574_11290 [Bacteroidia bacterium]
MFSMLNSVFSILYHDINKNIVIHTATGFLVANNGLFISVGHTFRNKEICNRVDIDNFRAFFTYDTQMLIKFKHIWYKSLNIWEQKRPEYIDIAVGLLDLNSISYLVLDRRRPTIGQDLTLYACLNTKPINNYGSDFSCLQDLDKIVLHSENMTVLQSDALISDLPSHYVMNREDVPPQFFYNNCITLSGKSRHGASGCPIIDKNGLVKGVLIGSPTNVNEIDILLSKWCSKIIQFKTNYKFNAYEYL